MQRVTNFCIFIKVKNKLIIFLIFALGKLTAQTQKDSLIVFVGQKISVTYKEEIVPNDTTIENGDTLISVTTSMDSRFVCKYKILKTINGFYKGDTIEFRAYDHYGTPAFSKHDTVMLFVSAEGKGFYHQKYLYFNLYLTQDGRWASSYPAQIYNHPFKKQFTVRPEKIKFKNEVSYSVKDLTTEDIKTFYPKPYYQIKDGKAIAIYGNYIEQLFLLEQQSYLKARGIY
jgi:hypothetical protein